jgi:cystathionine beta-synthase
MSVVDEWRSVDDRTAFAMARRLTREEGLFVGGSTGLIAHVALEVAREVDDPDACVVCILCDTGERYLSKLYSDEWLRENRLIEPRASPRRTMVAGKEDSAPRELVSVEPETPVRRRSAHHRAQHLAASGGRRGRLRRPRLRGDADGAGAREPDRCSTSRSRS